MATTTNYGWTTPDDTALVKDGASAIRSLGSSVDTTVKALNPETTLGDISYRSSTANTNTRLAIGSTGQVLTVSGGVPTWATASSGAVNFINKTTFSSSSGFNVDSVFSTTYDNYIMYISNTGSANGDLRMTFRSGGSTNTTSNYNTQNFSADSTNVTASRLGGAAYMIAGKQNTVRCMQTIFIQNPALSLPTGIQVLCQNNMEGLPECRIHYGNFQNTNTFDGFRIETGSGTITGTLYLFGVVNA